MKNRKYNLLPYETIVKAAAGEPEAVNTVIQTYTGYIKSLPLSRPSSAIRSVASHAVSAPRSSPR